MKRINNSLQRALVSRDQKHACFASFRSLYVETMPQMDFEWPVTCVKDLKEKYGQEMYVRGIK